MSEISRTKIHLYKGILSRISVDMGTGKQTFEESYDLSSLKVGDKEDD